MIQLILYIGLTGTLFILGLEDLKTRKVSVHIIVLLTILVFLNFLHFNDIEYSLEIFLPNLFFVVFQMGVLLLYLILVKRWQPRHFFNAFGLGDIFFLIAIIFLYHPQYFFFVYLISLTLALTSTLLLRIFHKGHHKIPLISYFVIVIFTFESYLQLNNLKGIEFSPLL